MTRTPGLRHGALCILLRQSQDLECVPLGSSGSGLMMRDHSDNVGADESSLGKDSSVPLMHPDPIDLDH